MAIPWIPILTLGANLLGGLLGKSESKSESGTENTTQSGTGVTSNTAQSATTQNQTQNQNTTQTSQQTGTEIQNGSSSSVGTGSVSRLDANTMSLLTSQVQRLLESSGTGDAAAKQRLSEITQSGSDFDVNKFVDGIMTSANDTVRDKLGSDMAVMAGSVGASGRSNSNVALLNGRLKTQAASNLAGINADAVAKGTQIKQSLDESKTAQIGALSQSTDSGLNGILNSLLQASETQVQNQNQLTNQSGSTQTGGVTTGNTNTVGVTTGTEKTNQVQSQTTAQQTNTNSSGKASGNATDMTKMFSSLGDILKTQF